MSDDQQFANIDYENIDGFFCLTTMDQLGNPNFAEENSLDLIVQDNSVDNCLHFVPEIENEDCDGSDAKLDDCAVQKANQDTRVAEEAKQHTCAVAKAKQHACAVAKAKQHACAVAKAKQITYYAVQEAKQIQMIQMTLASSKRSNGLSLIRNLCIKTERLGFSQFLS